MFGFLACIALVTYTASATKFPLGGPPASAFESDGFEIVQKHVYRGFTGILARNKHTHVLKTGLGKPLYYVEGDADAIGYLMGYLAPNETMQMATTYIDHVIPALIDRKLDRELRNNPETAKWYDPICKVLGNLLLRDVMKVWNGTRATVDPRLVQEMESLVDGAVAAGANSSIMTLDRIIALNSGIDLISVAAFTGQILQLIFGWLDEAGRNGMLSAEVVQHGRALFESQRDSLGPKAYCDAVAIRNSDGSSVFARDFQFSTAGIYENIGAAVLINPTDGRNALVGAGGPGFVGAMTVVNEHGLAMGVDTLRAALGNLTRPGLNSLLLVRTVADGASTVEEALDIITNAERGCPWLYPLADSTGDAAIVEAGPYQPPSQPIPDYTSLVSDKKLQALLPNASYLEQHAPVDFRNGIFVRRRNYSVPTSAIVDEFNPQLFEYANLPYNASNFHDPNGIMYANYSDENALWKTLGSRFFSPQRGPTSSPSHERVLTVSNFALSPQIRIAQMPFWPSVVPGEAMQWRFDTLTLLARQHVDMNNGSVDIETLKILVDFLSPCPANTTTSCDSHGLCTYRSEEHETLYCSPWYWDTLLNPGDPMSAVIEGSVTAADLTTRTAFFRMGYWADGWFKVTLPNYLQSNN